jgi:hypothetical protein
MNDSDHPDNRAVLTLFPIMTDCSSVNDSLSHGFRARSLVVRIGYH